MERVILDTGVLIAAERGRLDLARLQERNDDVCIAAVTAAELLTGVELAGEANRQRRQAFVEGVFALVPIEDYDVDVARAHARLLAHVRRSGRPPGAHDLVIAATAAATARAVATLDARGEVRRVAGCPGRATRLGGFGGDLDP